MLAIQLHALAAAVLVDLEAVREPDRGAAARLRAAAKLRILAGSAHVPEDDGIERIGASRAQLQVQVPAADDSGIDDLEIAVEHRFRKTLPPRARIAQDSSRLQGQFGAPQFAIRM